MKNSIRFLAVPALLLAAIFLPAAHAASFRPPTGLLATPRCHHTATTLPDGRVLFAGGESGSNLLSSVEVFNPATSFGIAIGSLSGPRFEHAAVLLADGTVLVVGGNDASVFGTDAAERYNPASGAWTATGLLTDGRIGHTATRLGNGKVLVAGGDVNSPADFSSAELFNPATGTWTLTVAMKARRVHHTATLLADGRVLVAGGNEEDSNSPRVPTAEIYTPDGGILTPVIWTSLSKTGGTKALRFTATPGGTKALVATPDLTLPLASWTVLGPATETAAGVFQYNDTLAGGFAQRFYRVIAP